MENSQLITLTGKVQRLSVERKYAQEREQVLRKELAIVRQRLALQPEVQKILDKTQHRLHQQTVGFFESLLTSLNKDVLEGNQLIRLNLEYNRGTPELEIFAEHNGNAEDLWDGTGGALTNIVCTGLRLIALTRSGLRPFLVLDEADNWCRPSVIPRFFNVFEQLAETLSVQTLFITHHDRELFGDSTHIIRLIREGDKTFQAKTINPVWKEDQAGIRWMRLKDLRLLADTTLSFSPGSNALTGENGIGKSSVVAALRGIAYGEANDGVIRHEAESCQVELGLEEGKVLRWTRVRKGSPKMRWVLFDEGGTILRESSSAKGLPEWLDEVLGIAKQDKLDIQLLHQKTPVFLLDEPASRQAAILSVGQDAAYLPELMQKYKRLLQEDTQTLKRGENELGDVLDKIKSTEKVPDLEVFSKDIVDLERQLQDSQKSLQSADNTIRSWETTQHIEKLLANETLLLERLEDVPAFYDLSPVIGLIDRWDREQSITVRTVPAIVESPEFNPMDKLIQFGKDWVNLDRLAEIKVPGQPEELAPLHNVQGLIDFGKNWQSLEKDLVELNKSLESAHKEAEVAFKELEAAWHEAGSCPLCGQVVSKLVSSKE